MSQGPNTFNTMQVRPWDHPQLKNSAEVAVPFHVTELPVGLNWLDIDRSNNIRIKASIDGFSDDERKATARLDAWADTVLYSAGSTWLDVCRPDRDFQFGTFATGSLSSNPGQTTKLIKFDKPYAVPPKIVVWLNELDMDRSKTWRVKAYAENITTTGFSLHVSTWADTILYRATATWIAHPSTRSNIASGEFNTKEIRPWEKPQLVNGTKITFDKQFERPPRVLVALNWLSVDCAHNLRIKVLTKNITTKGMDLNIDSWFDTKLYSGGASYLAIQDY